MAFYQHHACISLFIHVICLLFFLLLFYGQDGCFHLTFWFPPPPPPLLLMAELDMKGWIDWLVRYNPHLFFITQLITVYVGCVYFYFLFLHFWLILIYSLFLFKFFFLHFYFAFDMLSSWYCNFSLSFYLSLSPYYFNIKLVSLLTDMCTYTHTHTHTHIIWIDNIVIS